LGFSDRVLRAAAGGHAHARALYKVPKEEQTKRKLNSVQETARYILSEYFTNGSRKP
jgi:hypothetical protein